LISVIRNLPRTVELQAVSGLLSRTIFCQQVRKRTDEWKRGGPTFSVVLIKVNQYEQGGKYYSQEARVVAAQAITRFLTATVREMDIVGHYGSGCFALLLPMAGLADAIRIAERLREGFSEYTSLAQGEKLRCMMSVGVVQVTEKDDSILLLERAEAAMAVADHQGNNRTCCHDGERCTPIAAMLETTDYLA
jgi:diguanylate cyclase (GGDEF)-like protein